MNDFEHDQTAVKDTPAEETVTRAEPESSEAGKLVPVAEAKRYRKRAQAAEKSLADLEKELAARNSLVDQQKKQIDELQRTQQIDRQLVDADVLDLETSRLLIEIMLGDMEEPDPAIAVRDLRKRKPFLFRQQPKKSGALSPRVNGELPRERRLREVAAEAEITGHRQDLLRYLRLRRKKHHAAV